MDFPPSIQLDNRAGCGSEVVWLFLFLVLEPLQHLSKQQLIICSMAQQNPHQKGLLL